jgi:hypothetical protein
MCSGSGTSLLSLIAAVETMDLEVVTRANVALAEQYVQ